MNTLCVVPARGGSKRIPRKNIRPLLGRPLIAWTIAMAKNSGLFDEVMVSTDDVEIATIARQSGAAVPFMRSTKAADDHAPTAAAIRDVLDGYSALGVSMIDRVCCIYPTAVLLRAGHLAEAGRLLENDPTLDTAMSVQAYAHPIERAFRVRDGVLAPDDLAKQAVRTQDLEPAYHDAGQFYWFRTESFRRHGWMVGPRCAPVVMGASEAVDVDDESDWERLERLMAWRKAA